MSYQAFVNKTELLLGLHVFGVDLSQAIKNIIDGLFEARTILAANSQQNYPVK